MPCGHGYPGRVRRFVTPAWLLRHALLLVAVAACLALGWWQWRRAQGGNSLSYAYAVEWPVFAAFAVGVWVRELRLELRADRPTPVTPAKPVDPLLTTVPPPGRPPPRVGADEGELGAYNEYLAWLAEDPTRRPADYRR
jgi:hypothetical protein